jgi:hypothetical protein
MLHFFAVKLFRSAPPSPPPTPHYTVDIQYIYEEVDWENPFLFIIYYSYLLWYVNNNCPAQSLPIFMLNNIKNCSSVRVIGLMEH